MSANASNETASNETPTDTTASAAPRAHASKSGSSSLWWVMLVAGFLWLLYGMFVLSLRPGSITSVAILAGIAFILGGITQFITASVVQEWRWLWYVAGVLAIAAGIAAFVWPDITLLVLAVFIAWYLAIGGVVSIVAALMGPKGDWWWLGLLAGIAQVFLGVWAIGSPGRELLLLLNLVGISLILYGVTQIVTAFTVRSAEK